MTAYTIGQRPRSTWSVALNGAAADPPTVMFIVRRPDGSEHQSLFGVAGQPYPVTKTGVGVYYADIPLIMAGRWLRRWVAFDETGSPLDAIETPFDVAPTILTRPLGALPP